MSNCDRRMPISERISIINLFIYKMFKSEYSEVMRKEVVKSGLRGYYARVETEIGGGKRVNSPASEGLAAREMNKFTSKYKWFIPKVGIDADDVVNSKSDALSSPREKVSRYLPETSSKNSNMKSNCSVKVESVIFVPCTVRGVLQKMLQKKDDEFARVHGLPRIRFIERGGSKILDVLGERDPWGRSPCQRLDCWSCRHKASAGQCSHEGVVYSIICLGCKKDGILAEYTGESSRSLYQRGREHQRGYKDQKEDNPMWKHVVQHHGGSHQEFQLALIKMHHNAFNRQIMESVLITNEERDYTLNSKCEYLGEAIPRLTLEVRNVVQQVDHDGAKMSGGKRLQPHQQQTKQSKNCKPAEVLQPTTKKT